MKKICLILLCGMLLIGLSSSGVLQELYESAVAQIEILQNGGVEILAEYTFSDYNTKHVMVVKNHSRNPVDISTLSGACSEDGEVIEAATASLECLGSGCTSVLTEVFHTGTQVDYYETDIITSRSSVSSNRISGFVV